MSRRRVRLGWQEVWPSRKGVLLGKEHCRRAFGRSEVAFTRLQAGWECKRAAFGCPKSLLGRSETAFTR